MTATDAVKTALLKNPASRFVIKSLRNVFFPMPGFTGAGKTIGIEVSSICNARCIFCTYRLGYRAQTIMDLSRFRTIATSCVNLGYENLDLTSLGGELFTHPDALEIIRIAKKSGFKHIGAYTNAILIRRFQVEELLSSGVDALLISFPGFGGSYYREIFGVDAYAPFEDSVLRLLHAHRKLASRVSIVFEPRTYLTLRQIKNSPFYLDHLSRHVSDRIVLGEPLRVFDTWGGEISDSDLVGGMKADVNPIKSLSPLKKTYLCARVVLPGIQANGDVRLCNCRYDRTIETTDDDLFIGNIAGYDDLEALLADNCGKIASIWRDFRSGRLPALCRKCPFYLPLRMDDRQLSPPGQLPSSSIGGEHAQAGQRGAP